MNNAFMILKGKLTSPPVLTLPDFEKSFILETDASSVSLGAVLSQKTEDGKSHPIQYASRTMPDAEKKYSTCEIEALSVFSIDFAGPFAATPRGNKHWLVCVEHLTGRPIVIPTATAAALELIRLVEEQIIMPFGRPTIIVSDSGPCLIARSLEEFMKSNDIKWKTVLAYAPMSNVRAERMVGTVKRSIGKIVLTHPTDWGLAVAKVLYGYRQRNLSSGFSFFHLMYGSRQECT